MEDAVSYSNFPALAWAGMSTCNALLEVVRHSCGAVPHRLDNATAWVYEPLLVEGDGCGDECRTAFAAFTNKCAQLAYYVRAACFALGFTLLHAPATACCAARSMLPPARALKKDAREHIAGCNERR
eukprot:SAG11_NODE_5082_length_1669_cov_1.608280_2_plen_127_part_00